MDNDISLLHLAAAGGYRRGELILFVAKSTGRTKSIVDVARGDTSNNKRTV